MEKQDDGSKEYVETESRKERIVSVTISWATRWTVMGRKWNQMYQKV